jgi:hypothetical protein
MVELAVVLTLGAVMVVLAYRLMYASEKGQLRLLKLGSMRVQVDLPGAVLCAVVWWL